MAVERHLDELADPPQLALGLEDEVLELHLDVVAEVGRLGAPAVDAAAPLLRRRLDRLRPPALLEDRERDVAAVADQVDESRLGQIALDLPHRLHVAGGLVAPAGAVLALLVGVQVKKARTASGPLSGSICAQRAASSPGSIVKSPQRRCEVSSSSICSRLAPCFSRAEISSGMKWVSEGIAISGGRRASAAAASSPSGSPRRRTGPAAARGAAAERGAAAPPAGDRAEDLAAGLHRSSPANSAA